MLKRNNRLKKVRDFNLLMKYGQWINGSFLDLKYLRLAKVISHFPKKEDPKNFKNQLRIAFSIGLKIDKRAIRRNLVKRQLNEVIASLIKTEMIQNGYYLMLKPKKEILGKEYTEISKEIKVLLSKSKILNRKKNKMKNFFKKILYIPRLPFLLIIKFYQKTISPDHGLLKFIFRHGYCRFYPSCSQYGYESIKKRGLIIGLPKTIWRIIRCNPWNKGGVDLP